MRWLLQLHGDRPLDDYPRLAARAEELGFEDVTVHDVLLRRPVWPVLCDVARATSRVLVGPNVTHPWLTHPIQLAANVRHLDDVSQGRAVCGIGRGSMYDLTRRDNPSSLAGLREAIDVINALSTGSGDGVDGTHFAVAEGARLQFGTPRRIPIWLGSLGPRGAEFAGRHADGLRVAAQWAPDYALHLQQALQRGALEAGRDPSDVDLVVENWTCVHPDRDRARHDARVLLSAFLPDMGPLIRYHGIPDREVAAAIEVSRHGRTSEVSVISDRTVDLFMAAGDDDDLRRGLRRLIDAGLETISFSGRLGPDTDQALELIGAAITDLQTTVRS